MNEKGRISYKPSLCVSRTNLIFFEKIYFNAMTSYLSNTHTVFDPVLKKCKKQFSDYYESEIHTRVR